MEGVDVSLGVVPQALPGRRAEAVEEDGRLSVDLLFIYV